MKIIIEHEPEKYNIEDIETTNFSIHATIDIPSNATATEAIVAVYKALSIEGYTDKSIVKALIDVASYCSDDFESLVNSSLQSL